MRAPIVLDVEAVAIDGAGDYLEPVEAPANYKDPAKIEAYKLEKQAELLSRAALDPDLARICALGTEQNGVEQVQIITNEGEEREAIEAFWDRVRPYPWTRLVGFNICGYDLPLLMRRSLYLGVKWPAVSIGRYKHPDVDDLMLALSFDGALKFRGLPFYAKRMGLSVEDTHTGADVAALMAAGDTAAVAAHCLSDLRLTRALAERLGVLKPLTVTV